MTSFLYFISLASDRSYDEHQMQVLMEASGREAFKSLQDEGRGLSKPENSYMVDTSRSDAGQVISDRVEKSFEYINRNANKSDKKDLIFYMYRIIAPQPNTVMPSEQDMKMIFLFGNDMGFGPEEMQSHLQEVTRAGGLDILGGLA